jgi:hypothetical protein
MEFSLCFSQLPVCFIGDGGIVKTVVTERLCNFAQFRQVMFSPGVRNSPQSCAPSAYFMERSGFPSAVAVAETLTQFRCQYLVDFGSLAINGAQQIRDALVLLGKSVRKSLTVLRGVKPALCIALNNSQNLFFNCRVWFFLVSVHINLSLGVSSAFHRGRRHCKNCGD